MTPRRFAVTAHQNKADAFIDALERRGYIRVKTLPEADFYLTDWTFTYKYFAGDVCWAQQLEIPVFLYPHTARPGLWDFHNEHFPVRCNFVYGEGHKEIMQQCDYPRPIEVIGWPLTPVKPFKDVDYKKRLKVLFAPIHPNQNGWLHELDRDLNYRTFITLLAMLDKVDLKVRHVGSLSENNIYDASLVEYVKAKPDGSTIDIQAADVVVGSYTLAAMSIALGKPTVMLGDAYRPRQGQSEETTLFSLNWEKWKRYARYPFCIEDVLEDPERAYAVLRGVCFKSHAVEYWKRRFIGKPFDPDDFVGRLEKHL